VGLSAKYIIIARGGNVGNDHAIFNPLLEVDVFVQADVGPVIH